MTFQDEPITWADLILIFPVVVTEIVAAVSDTSEIADHRLEDIGSRLLDFGNAAADGRAKLLISALAKQLIATEEGA